MANKPLKFQSDALALIESGESDITWRLFDDKDLAVGDTIDLIDVATDEKMGEARIVSVEEKRMAELDDEDYDGVERFDTPQEMYDVYAALYDEEVGPDTMVKVIRFEVIPEVLDEDEMEDEVLDEEETDDFE